MLSQMGMFHSFLGLSDIPLHVYIYTHTHTMSFFIHSFIYGHLGCFHILPIQNNAAVNTGTHNSFQICIFVFSGKILISSIAGSYISYIFNFLKNIHTFFSTNRAQVLPFLHNLNNTCYIFLIVAILTGMR